MKRIRVLGRRLSGVFGKRKRGREISEEIESNLRLHIDDNVRAGMPPDEARRQALIKLGGVEPTKEAYSDQRGLPLLESFFQDLRYGSRMLRRSPGFTLVVVLTLALGIGANTALFTVIDAVLLKPLPVKNPDRLALMVWDSPTHAIPLAESYDGTATSDNSTTGNLEGTSFPYITFERMQQAKETFSDVFAFATSPQLNVIVGGDAEVATGQFVTGDYFDGLGARAWIGRTLTEADQSPSAAPVAVVTWSYWQRRMGADARAVGEVITINKAQFTVVGVTAPEFEGALELGQTADLTLPLQKIPQVFPDNPVMAHPGLWWLHVMARLQPGVSRQDAQARMDPVFKQSALDGWRASQHDKAAPVSQRDYPSLFVRPGAQGDEFARRQYRQPLGLLMAVVGLVLLIACINVANLLLARSSARQQEFAMRVALGARRSRLVRQLLTECLLLATIAGEAGLVLATWGTRVLMSWTRWIRGDSHLAAGIDVRVLAFAAGATVLTAILFGMVPALRAGRTNLAPSMKLQIGNPGSARGRMGRVLIAAQVAISLVLLVGAGLFLRTLRNLESVDAGFNRNHLLLFRINPQAGGYTDATSGPLYDTMIERLGHLPGVQAAALSRQPLLSFTHKAQAVYLNTGNEHNGEIVEVNVVSPSFFDTMEIPILLGRRLLDSDTPASPVVAVVNQTFASTYFPGESPIGQQFWLGGGGEGTGSPLRRHLIAPPNNRPFLIVGISRDAKYTELRSRFQPTVYEPYAQSPTLEANFEIRYRGDLTAITTLVRDTVRQIDPKLPVYDLRTQNEQSDDSIAEERMFADLSGFMGGLALLLAAIGLYGVMSYSVRRRTPEIGVRMALGARRSTVLSMVVREAVVVVVAGVVVGIPVALASAYAASSVLSDVLFGINVSDPLSFVAAVATLILFALLASYFPARRAARVDPMVALRYE